MPAFTKAELEAAFAHYTDGRRGAAQRSGDWAPFGDLFTEDVHYIEHAYGEMHGRETVRAWIQTVMAPFPHMRFPSEWQAYDEENGAVVVHIKNLLDHPTDPGRRAVLVPELDPAGLRRRQPVVDRRRTSTTPTATPPASSVAGSGRWRARDRGAESQALGLGG